MKKYHLLWVSIVCLFALGSPALAIDDASKGAEAQDRLKVDQAKDLNGKSGYKTDSLKTKEGMGGSSAMVGDAKDMKHPPGIADKMDKGGQHGGKADFSGKTDTTGAPTGKGEFAGKSDKGEQAPGKADFADKTGKGAQLPGKPEYSDKLKKAGQFSGKPAYTDKGGKAGQFSGKAGNGSKVGKAAYLPGKAGYSGK